MTTTLNTTPVITGPLSELDVRRFLKSGVLPKEKVAAKPSGSVLSTTLITLFLSSWGVLIIAAAYWARWNEPIWGAF